MRFNKKFPKKLTALAVIGAFLFQQVACAFPTIGAKEVIFPIARHEAISECGGGDALDKGECQLSEGHQWQQLSFPLEVILSFGLNQDSSDHEYPKQTHQNDPHPLREPFKEITSQSHRKNCFIKVQEEFRNGFASAFANELFPHVLSILYSVCRSKNFVSVQQGIAVGVAETIDNPVIAAAVTSAIGGGLRGRYGR
jgi:hypothetical protein